LRGSRDGNGLERRTRGHGRRGLRVVCGANDQSCDRERESHEKAECQESESRALHVFLEDRGKRKNARRATGRLPGARPEETQPEVLPALQSFMNEVRSAPVSFLAVACFEQDGLVEVDAEAAAGVLEALEAVLAGALSAKASVVPSTAVSARAESSFMVVT